MKKLLTGLIVLGSICAHSQSLNVGPSTKNYVNSNFWVHGVSIKPDTYDADSSGDVGAAFPISIGVSPELTSVSVGSNLSINLLDSLRRNQALKYEIGLALEYWKANKTEEFNKYVMAGYYNSLNFLIRNEIEFILNRRVRVSAFFDLDFYEGNSYKLIKNSSGIHTSSRPGKREKQQDFIDYYRSQRPGASNEEIVRKHNEGLKRLNKTGFGFRVLIDLN